MRWWKRRRSVKDVVDVQRFAELGFVPVEMGMARNPLPPKGGFNTPPRSAVVPSEAWVPGQAWSEHDPVPEPPPTDVVTPEEPPVVPQDPPPVAPEPVVCGYVGTVEGQSTTCILLPGHKYLNGKPSPHKGTVTVIKIIPTISS